MFVLVLVGCSRQKVIDSDELRSDLTAAISLASETETVIDFVGQHRATVNYATGHIAYLAETARQDAKELHEAIPAPSIAQKFLACRQQLDALASQLASLRSELARQPGAPANTEQLVKLRHALEQARASL
jgi:hypothetical protein